MYKGFGPVPVLGFIGTAHRKTYLYLFIYFVMYVQKIKPLFMHPNQIFSNVLQKLKIESENNYLILTLSVMVLQCMMSFRIH